MFVVLSYYGDSSEAAKVKFFPINREQSGLLITHLVNEMDLDKYVEAYELTSINEPETLIVKSGPQPQREHNG